MEAEDFGWIAGCWWGRDVGGEECKFVEDLLEQVAVTKKPFIHLFLEHKH